MREIYAKSGINSNNIEENKTHRVITLRKLAPNLPPLPPPHFIQHHRAGDGDIQRVAGSVHRDGDGCVAL